MFVFTEKIKTTSGIGSLNTPVYVDSDGTIAACSISGGQSDTAKSVYNQVINSASNYFTIDASAISGHNWLRLTTSSTSDITNYNTQSILQSDVLELRNKGSNPASILTLRSNNIDMDYNTNNEFCIHGENSGSYAKIILDEFSNTDVPVLYMRGYISAAQSETVIKPFSITITDSNATPTVINGTSVTAVTFKGALHGNADTATESVSTNKCLYFTCTGRQVSVAAAGYVKMVKSTDGTIPGSDSCFTFV